MEEVVSVEVEGERFAALARGDEARPLVLLLHGFPDVPGSWAPVMERLAAAGFRCVAPWLRGYAPSPRRGPFHADRLAADARGLAEALRPEGRVHLVGHDWGAAAAYVAAMRAPERWASLTALSVPHPLTFLRALARSPAQLSRSWYMGFFQLPVLPEMALRRGLIERLWRAWSPGFEPPAAHLAEVVRTVIGSLPGPIEPYRAMTRPPREAWARVRDARGDRIAVPTRYLHGADDGCIAASVAEGQEACFVGPFTSRVTDGGHFLPIEQPDAVAHAILAQADDHPA
ncbi:MAG TPA: alpha/beta fold hydrolase [Sandaracinaceae bacterium LLY-WYZ-13_1]|nr:alpha/beta fold hydrolase [Sandaracinaceae bacterium LLY-WYZ-13_1]